MKTIAINATDIPPRIKASVYPEPFASRMAGREKRQLGDFFGLNNFGVNLTRLTPGAISALRHAHTRQDEFVYILQGNPTLHTNAGATRLEKRSDMKISTLQGYIEALGGKLNLTVDFPGRAFIRLQDIGMGHTP